MIVTAHAKKRLNERGIPEYALDMAMDSSLRENRPGGAILQSIRKEDIDMKIHEYKSKIQQLEKLKRRNISIIFDKTNKTVITAYSRK